LEPAADRGIPGSDRHCNAGKKSSPGRDALRGNHPVSGEHIICPASRAFLQRACAISSGNGLRVRDSPFRVNNPANYPVIPDVAKWRTVIQKRRRNYRISVLVLHGDIQFKSSLLLNPRVPVKGNHRSEDLGSAPPATVRLIGKETLN
jgi:hypothetical protein